MLDQEFLKELQEYIERHTRLNFAINESVSNLSSEISEYPQPYAITNYINNNRKPEFNQVLFEFIDQKGKTDLEIYQKAGIDRRHFSKIRTNPNYRPGKNTVIALSIALKLNKEETGELLSSAGFSLSENDTFDLVILFCIEKNIYDMAHVDMALSYFSLKSLSGALQ